MNVIVKDNTDKDDKRIHSSNNKNKNYLSVRQVLAPLSISMRICGMFHNGHEKKTINKIGELEMELFEKPKGCWKILWNTDIADNHVLVGMYIFWVAGGLVMLGFISLGGAIVHQEAHGIFDELHELDLENANCELMGQVAMLLNRVSSGSIGMTALKLFVVDKQSILTILGMMITYFIVIVQFAPGNSNSLLNNHNNNNTMV
ncbi:hypothetical protein LSH36_216g07079 [Paralvinella palmiformis]|uniref:Uncharacterized protein n=1 Tax=Paralvinella palmiformis TaxID=53620 RepID=A0AAD9JQM6_9ANNE|nr:hypothetical protein LSH36_216g07079 [Paralvinella palmiformis]